MEKGRGVERRGRVEEGGVEIGKRRTIWGKENGGCKKGKRAREYILMKFRRLI